MIGSADCPRFLSLNKEAIILELKRLMTMKGIYPKAKREEPRSLACKIIQINKHGHDAKQGKKGTQKNFLFKYFTSLTIRI